MPVFKWQRRATVHFGEAWVPFAQVDVRDSTGRFRSFSLQIDSGAVVSLLRRSTGDLLGVQTTNGRRIELGSVGGRTTVAHVHALPTRFSETMVFPVEYAIAETESVPNLLGRRGVFDNLQIDFDSTLAHTMLAPRWLDDGGKRLWDALCAASERVAQCWPENPLPAPGDEAAGQLLRRGEQLFATAAAMMRSFCTYDAPLVVRAMFEVSVQFEYLLQSPTERGKLFLDFAKVTRHRDSKRIADNPQGPIGRQIANSPMRAEGEIRNQIEFDEVAAQFQRGKKKNDFWDKWYCKSLGDLTQEPGIGKRGEYDIWYKFAAGWAHGDPFATQRVAPFPGSGIPTLFSTCLVFLGRMLFLAAEAKKILLVAEQYELLKACLEKRD
jgi:hypothetical protein